jgi:uncharacterized repeat protein (TIGR03803 family)
MYSMRLAVSVRSIAAVATVFGMMAGLMAGSAQAYRFRVLHSICDGVACLSGGGAGTASGLMIDAAGNLYGTSMAGGPDAGSVFEISRGADGKTWNYQVLHNFCSRSACADGAVVWSPLIADIAGNLYGVTTVGGKGGFGTAFKLSPSADRSSWTYNVLHTFCPQGSWYCSEADSFNFGLTYAGAASGAPYDGHSPLYGSSSFGGTSGGNVFVLTPKPGTTKWSFRQVYAFCAASNCADGTQPLWGNVIADVAGNLYGTTLSGGARNAGVVFALSPDGHGGWSENVLYSFCSLANCTDGKEPVGSLLLDGAGNLFGTTASADSNCADGASCGVVFKLAPGTPWREKVLHRFCQQSGCTDGSGPQGGLLMDAKGHLFGTTGVGGPQNSGTVFRLGGSFDVLYSFCAQANCADGKYPWPAIVSDAAGNIFGATERGGANGYGDVFELAKWVPPARFRPAAALVNRSIPPSP